MKHLIILLAIGVIAGQYVYPTTPERALEAFTYREDFEANELNAWASYPLWQDTAYDPNMRVYRMIPGDPNLSIVQKVISYSHMDVYAGAQKKLDMFMVPGCFIKLKYYLKTHLSPEFFKVRLAAGSKGKVDYTLKNPVTNGWESINITYDNFSEENPTLEGKDIKVNALAILAKFPDADPDMPIYLGIDDVIFEGARSVDFRFEEPTMFKLSEWKPYIPQKHYLWGETFTLKGSWPLKASNITLSVVSFTDRSKICLDTALKKTGEEWFKEFKLIFPEGLYLATLEACNGNRKLSETQFTIYIVPKNTGKNHPRLWFDDKKKNWVESRLKSERFKKVAEDIVSQAKKVRVNNPIEGITYDIDQFHGGEIDPTWGMTIVPWMTRIHLWRSAVYYNALAYSLLGDLDAGKYGKDFLVRLCTFPPWTHPWWLDRGRHIYYQVGELGMDLALGYDLMYELMDGNERNLVRGALKKQIIIGAHKGYVEDNLVTNNTSNWVAHVAGSSLVCQAAIYNDGPDVAQLEPYFTGIVFKAYDFIQKAFGRDGSYGEGYGYYEFTMLSLSKSLPAFENVFKVDMSGNINGSYKELIWAGIEKKKQQFFFGDSEENLKPFTNWAWLLVKNKDPVLAWLYHFLKKEETLMDVLYDTENISRDDPFQEIPVRIFRDVGTTVFKSGWEDDDFVFVMRTGAFYNHQHMDQGSFWLSDRGNIFIEERHGGRYYPDPIYRPWYIQPIAHSTILIDHNPQSQRVGDPLEFAQGFHDHAFVYHFLDGTDVAFSSGDITRVYWGKVKTIRRNVLYLKPRTILMLDVIVPGDKDVDVTLLYQTAHLEDIHEGQEASTITKGNKNLNIKHVFPKNLVVKALKTPHYLDTLRNEHPLKEEGMLAVTARTQGKPLVLANLLTTIAEGKANNPFRIDNGHIFGMILGKSIAFSTNPGHVYSIKGLTTDALTLTWDGEKVFAALCKTLKREGKNLVESQKPITFEISENDLKYYLADKATVAIGVDSWPLSIFLKGKRVDDFKFDGTERKVVLDLPAGEGCLAFKKE